MSADPAEFFVAGGTLPSDAPSYIPRQADTDLLHALERGEFCYVLTTRQMGKSSLMVRTVAALRGRGIDAVVIDLTAIGLHVTTEQWYRGLLNEVGEQLRQEEALEVSWRAHAALPPMQRWLRAVRDVLGCPAARPLVIFVDEIDVVLSLPFRTDDFFAGIRELHNRRARDSALGELTFCLLGVASPTDLIGDPKLTPFNIGRRIELSDFTPAEASALAAGLAGPPARAKALLARVLFWTGAHPYLTQRLCQSVALDARAARAADVDRCCRRLFLSTDAREHDDNLVFVREHLLTRDGSGTPLLHLYESVLRGRPIADERLNRLVSSLYLSGIVRADRGRLQVRNRIYARVFDRRWVRRNLPEHEIQRERDAFRRGVFRAAVISAASLAVLLSGTGFLLRQRNLLRAEQEHSRRLLYAAEMNLAGQSWESGSPARTADLLPRHMPRAGDDDLRGFEWFHLWWLVHGDPRALLGSVRQATRVRFAPDGRRLAVGGWNGRVDVWDTAGSRRVLSLPATDQIHIVDLAYSPDGKQLATAGENGTVRIWDPLSGTLLFELRGHARRVCGVAFSRDGRLLASAGADRTIRLWDPALRREIRVLRGHTAPINVVRFSPDDRRLASAGWDNTARLWDVPTGRAVGVLQHQHDVEDLAFTPDGAALIAVGWDARLNIWNVRERRLVTRLPGHRTLVTGVAIAPDGDTVASTSHDGTVRLWSLRSGLETSRIRAAGRHVRSVDFARDGRLATVSDDARLRIWQLEEGEIHHETRTIRTHGEHVTWAEFSPGGDQFVTASADGTARLWRTSTGTELAVLPHEGVVSYASYSPDGRLVVTVADGSGALVVWDAATGARLRTLGERKDVCRPLFARNGSLMVALAGSRIVTWRVGTWDVESDVDTGARVGRVAAVSPDGTVLVTGNDSGVVRFWSVAPIVLRRETRPHADLVSAIAFRPNSDLMASGSFDGSIGLWNWRTGELQGTLKGHQGWITSLAISPDGSRLVSGGNDGTVKFWHLATQQELVSFRRHADVVSALSFARNGLTVVSTGDTVRLWRAATRDEVTHAAESDR